MYKMLYKIRIAVRKILLAISSFKIFSSKSMIPSRMRIAERFKQQYLICQFRAYVCIVFSLHILLHRCNSTVNRNTCKTLYLSFCSLGVLRYQFSRLNDIFDNTPWLSFTAWFKIFQTVLYNGLLLLQYVDSYAKLTSENSMLFFIILAKNKWCSKIILHCCGL